MDQLKDIAAWLMLASILVVVLIAFILGLKAIFAHIIGYGTYKLKQRENQEEIAAYRARVKELELKEKAIKVDVS